MTSPTTVSKPAALLSTAGLLVLVGLALVGLALKATPARAAGTTFYAAPGGTGNCSSWAQACTLQTALANATSGDQIWVKAGVHTPTTNSADRSASFVLKSGVQLYGGFAGNETQLSQRNWALHKTILSGDLDNNDTTDPSGVVTGTANIIGSNSYHVVSATGVLSTAMLDGFTITAGQAAPNNSGGGMLLLNSRPTLRHLVFSGNAAGSPAIDAGTTAFLPADVTTDLDGQPRVEGRSVDMGAYEFGLLRRYLPLVIR